MPRKPELSHNILANALQIVLSIALIFVLYRSVNLNLGVEQLGIWAVVLASVSFSRLADFGISSSVTRFVATALSNSNTDSSLQIVETSVTTVATAIGVLIPILYIGLFNFFPLLISEHHFADAVEILPYALVSLWLTAISTVQLGGLDGHQRMIARASLETAGIVIYVLLALFLLKPMQLIGLAWAQIAQAVFMVIGSRILLRQSEPRMPVIPFYWNWQVLKKMLGYGIHVQISGFAASLLDPLTKILLSKFGGVSAAGYFEMASQVVEKSRSILSAGNRAVVPTVARLFMCGDKTDLQRLYRTNMQIVHALIIAGCILLLAASDLISYVLLGEIDKQFVLLMVICTIGWTLNSLAIPAFYFNLGTGHVRVNSLSMTIMALINIPLGVLLGKHFGSVGAAIAYGTAISIGGGVLLALSVKHIGGRVRGILSIHNLPIYMVFTIALVLALNNHGVTGQSSLLHLILTGLVCPILIVVIILWIHPVRKLYFTSLVKRI